MSNPIEPIDSVDLIENDKELESWMSIYEFRKNVLGLPESEVLKSIQENRELERQIAAGTAPDPYLDPIEPQYSIAECPMSPEEQVFYKETVEFRTTVLKLSQEEAEKSTTEDIERGRRTAAMINEAKAPKKASAFKPDPNAGMRRIKFNDSTSKLAFTTIFKATIFNGAGFFHRLPKNIFIVNQKHIEALEEGKVSYENITR